MADDNANNPPDDDMAGSTLAPPSLANLPDLPTLPNLPFEILRMVVWHERLSQDDVQALRLTARAFNTVAATRLFYRIHISKLNTDREAFLAICHSPHLAPHVHEVEWLEISCDVNLADRIAEDEFWTRRAKHDDTAAVCSYFEDRAKASFWMVNTPHTPPDFDRESVEVARQRAVAEFRDDFMAAIDLLPSLHTFISRPMTSARIINSDPAYPITADYFQRDQEMAQSIANIQLNDGFFFFLAPAMERPSSTVTQLRWADEFPGYSYARPLPASAFARLESLELCFKPSGIRLVDNLGPACALAAPTLRHLKLCVDHGHPDHFRNGVEGIMIVLGPALASSPVCNLSSLSLVATACGTDRLLGIIQANEHSLRHLHIEAVSVKGELIVRLSQLTHLKLDTIQIIYDTSNTLVCEHALARYINGEQPRKACCPIYDPGWEVGCDQALRDRLEESPSSQVLTGKPTWGAEEEPEYGSSRDSEASDDSWHCRQRSAPKWAWARFFADDAGQFFVPKIYCFQVPDSDPRGHKTERWKFISRSGKIAYGVEPLDWFQNWDPDAGDVEEPIPYCKKLYEFHCHGEWVEERMSYLVEYLGKGSRAWDFIQKDRPPEGSICYDEILGKYLLDSS